MTLRGGGGGGGGGGSSSSGGRVFAFVLLFLCEIRADPCAGEIKQFIQCAQNQHDITLCERFNKVLRHCRLSNLAGHKATLRETYELTTLRSRLAHYNKRSTIIPREIQTKPGSHLAPGPGSRLATKPGSRLAHYNKRSTITHREIQTEPEPVSRLALYNKRSTIIPREIQTKPEPVSRLALYNKRSTIIPREIQTEPPWGDSSSSSNNNNSSGIIVFMLFG